jgi:hypothetical protein
VTAKLAKFLALTGVMAASAALAGCGEFVRDGRSPARLVINSLQGASGATPEELGSFLLSDVITNITTGGTCTPANPCPSRFNDPGQVELRLQLRDPGTPLAPSSPSAMNAVTINRYTVRYRRSDGRNTPGIDVPFPIDGAITVTVPADGSITAGFELVRNVAKREAPLAALAASNDTLITVIADVTFYGRDLAGNEVSVTGSIEITFGNFGDPA